MSMDYFGRVIRRMLLMSALYHRISTGRVRAHASQTAAAT